MMFAIGLVVLFTIGGLSGVTHAVAPSDTQQTDTYYIVAHFHYVLFGGAVFGLFAGFYYWWPKVFGKMLSETLGKINFWLMFIGMNLTFGPMHILGLEGQPRRMYRYAPGMGFDTWNLIESIGAFILAAGILVFLINVIKTARGPKCQEDPWDARTIEWMTTSPPKPHNFDSTLQIAHLDEYWHRKYEETEDGHGLRRVATYDEVMAAEVPDEHIHMPSPSYWPIVIAARPAPDRCRDHLQPVDLGDRRAHRVRRPLRPRARAGDGTRGAPRRAAPRRAPRARHARGRRGRTAGRRSAERSGGRARGGAR